MADWSSLPGDLVNRIADRLLASDDLDYYMDLRAVCRGWRSSTDDPRSSPQDPPFRPRQWAILDEVRQSDDARLFVNTGTGRFVRKDLSSLLRRYFLVAGAAGGSVVLKERSAPHAARVLNPFTGSMVSFEAQTPSPSKGKFAAHVIGALPTLVLVSDDSIYWADPDSKSFIEHKEEHFAHPLIRLALEGGIYAAAREGGPLASFLVAGAKGDKAKGDKIWDLQGRGLARYFLGTPACVRCFLVESAREMLIVFKLRDGVDVFRVGTGSNLLEPVNSLGSRALFVGDCRCLCVDADKFASVEPNCIYYSYVVEAPLYDVCVYSLELETEFRAMYHPEDVRSRPTIDFFNIFTLLTDPPFSEVQLLCWHTFEAWYTWNGLTRFEV